MTGAETSKLGVRALAVGLGLTLAIFGQADAQLATGKGPIDMSADELVLNDAAHTAVWKGAVDAVQGDDRLRADQVTLFFSGSGKASGGAPGKNWGDVQRMEAEGNVFFVSPQQRARGDHAVYSLQSGDLVMTGDVIVAQGQSVVRGDKLIIEVKTGHATMVSAAKGRNAPNRVRGVFFPDQNSKSGRQ